ncbi:hypothetical protein OsI_33558 [Oryza sativa Indica Group]|uniref:NAC domain-containing protein n=1 Tax=Oryza sativa subsp. indica TaxID=39946 RepID=A2Z787_ORYSI|nr:hypothetical protein OsI_33558 [Oryza sativa Indica Group]
MAAPEDGEDKNFGKNKHGLPIGFYFAPTDQELLAILEAKRLGRPLSRAHDAFFHDIRILDFHPAELYEKYAKDEEKGYIYFFSKREFPTSSKKRPLRVAEGGAWNSSGAVYKVVKSSKSGGGYDVGHKKTLVFHQRFPGDKEAVKTNWAIQEFTRIIGPQNEVPDLAVYRLYKMRKEGRETPADLAADEAAAAAAMNNRGQQASAAAMALPPPATGLPGGRMMSMADKANMASTSKAYGPSKSSSSQLQQDAAAAAAPPNAAGASNWAPRPCNCRECAPAAGHYGYFAAAAAMNNRGGQASAAAKALPLPAPGLPGVRRMSMADKANMASTSKAYATSQSSSSQLQQGAAAVAAPPNAAGPSNWAPRPCNCRECAPAAGQYGYFASMVPRPSLDRKGKGKAPMDCAEQAAGGGGCHAESKSTPAPPKGAEYYGCSVAVEDDDEELLKFLQAMVRGEEVEGDGDHAMADERGPQQGSSPVAAAAASGSAPAGHDGRRGSLQGGHHGSSSPTSLAAAAATGDDVTAAASAGDDVSGSQQEDHPAR